MLWGLRRISQGLLREKMHSVCSVITSKCKSYLTFVHKVSSLELLYIETLVNLYLNLNIQESKHAFPNFPKSKCYFKCQVKTLCLKNKTCAE